MLRAAIYARKSPSESGASGEDRSVARQVEQASDYAIRKGWFVAEEHIYVDDLISGAEFATRPAFMRLMNALKPMPTFDVLVMSEKSRIGRETIETAYVLKQFVTAGVRVWSYMDGRELVLETPIDKLLLSVTSFADEVERERARQRTYDAMIRKAKANHVTGGRVFGYDNVEVMVSDDRAGGARRSHVIRRINEAEAAVVRRMFEMAAAGSGVRRIARALNDDGVPTPQPQRSRPASWSPSSVFEALQRPLYRGEIVWNRTRKRNAWGQRQQSARPESEWMRIAAPELRIVSEDLWNAAHDRRAKSRETYLQATDGVLFGRRCDRDSKYLLSGFARCAVCGGGMLVKSRDHRSRRAYFYACSWHHDRGEAACRNNTEARIELVDRAVLDAIDQDVLRPEILSEALDRAIALIAEPTDPGRVAVLESRLAEVCAESARLSEAIAKGGGLDTLLTALQERDRERKRLQAQLTQFKVSRPRIDRRGLERDLRRRLEDWRGLLHRQVAQGREFLRQLLAGPLKFTPSRQDGHQGYLFEGSLALDRIIFSVQGSAGLLASPAGVEPASPP